MSDLKKNGSAASVLVDSGNLLFKKATIGKATPAQLLTAEAIAESYVAMGYDGVGIGERDLAGGIELLRKAEGSGLLLLSANLYDTNERRLFEPYRIVEKSGIKVGIVAVTGLNQVSADFLVRDAGSELESILPELEGQSDLVILLSSLPYKQTLAILGQFSQIDIAVTADRSKGNLSPVHSGNAIVVQTGSRGQYLGVLDVTLRSGPWIRNRDNELTKLKRQLKNITMLLNQVQTLPPEAQADRRENLENQQRQLREKIADVEGTPAPSEQDQFSSYRSRFLPLSKSDRQDIQIEEIVRRYQKEIRTAQRTK